MLDDRSIIFPIERLAVAGPGTYAVQAILHVNRDLNMPNAPGDLYSEAKNVRLDAAPVARSRSRSRGRCPTRCSPLTPSRSATSSSGR